MPGEDGYGPVEPPTPLPDFMLSVWSGRVVMRATLASLGDDDMAERAVPTDWLDDPTMRSPLQVMYEVAAARWERMATQHPGSARLWRDLAGRAHTTAHLLTG